MPIDYSKTKIYKIIDLTSELPPYFGSTCQSLSVRMGGHRSKSNKCSSKQIIEKGKNNYKCVLVENYPCKNKEEQIKRESWFIENNDCINKKNPQTNTYSKSYIEHNKKNIENIKNEKKKKLILNKTCDYCFKVFKRKQNKDEHLIICKKKKK